MDGYPHHIAIAVDITRFPITTTLSVKCTTSIIIKENSHAQVSNIMSRFILLPAVGFQFQSNLKPPGPLFCITLCPESFVPMQQNAL